MNMMSNQTTLEIPQDDRPLPRLMGPALAMLGGLECGSLDLVLPDGRVFPAKGPLPGPHGVIEVRDLGLFAALARDGQLGFAESYMDGGWTTPDLQALLDTLLLNNEVLNRAVPGAGLVRAYERLRHAMRPNSKRGSRKNISAHYDLGNDFYSLWLDPSMTYSSALFETGAESTLDAQNAKYAAMCDGIGVKEGDRLLEIGCGWGGFAEYAATHRGAHVKALTISREQHDFAAKRIQAAGLSERVQIVMQDYRDETGLYDGIASIEMFEAVGEKYWPVYFDKVHQCLKPDARGTFQIITVADELFADYRKQVDFIQKYIFPGGMLPSPSALRAQVERAGLKWVSSIEFGESYSITLRRWYEDFNAAWPEIAAQGFDERFRKMWNFYLTSCASCFHAGTSDVTQVTLRKSA